MEFLEGEFAFLIQRLLPHFFVATLCGFIVEYGREVRHKPSGIRMLILICVGCTLYGSLGLYLAEKNPNADPTRIIGQIAAGIGFLGAGAIVKSDKKVTVVTPATFICAMSGISILIGSNLYLVPIVLTLLLVLIIWAFEKFEKTLHADHNESGE
jgi:putative Mg2+ transporter-C (MgtC) family protein